MKRLILGLVTAATLATTGAALAQPIDGREAHQQARIEQGVRTGALTPRETTRLERREFRARRIETAMRERDGGRLTRHDRHVLKRVLNRDSRAIYRLKHNRRFD